MQLSEYRQAIKDELGITGTDPRFTDSVLNNLVNRALRTIGSAFLWQETQFDWKMQITPVGDASDEYWEYPTDAITDSVWRVASSTDVNSNTGTPYKLITYEAYLKRKDEGGFLPDDRFAADHRRLLYLYPTPTSTLWLFVWGHRVPPKLVNDTDLCVFHSNVLIEEAVTEYAISLAYRMLGSSDAIQTSNTYRTLALDKAQTAHQRQRENQQYRQSDGLVMWESPEIL